MSGVEVWRKWVVLGACFLIMAICPGFIWSSNVLYTAIMGTFDTTRSEASLVLGAIMGFAGFTGFPNGMLVHWLGCRRSGIIGGVLGTISLVLSYFATGVFYLTATLGAGLGTAISILYTIAQTEIGKQFEGKAKTYAMSFVIFGVGAGGMIWPHLLAFLLEEYGLKGALLIYGGILANCVVCSALTTSSAQPPGNSTKAMATISEDKKTNSRSQLQEKPDSNISVVHSDRDVYEVDGAVHSDRDVYELDGAVHSDRDVYELDDMKDVHDNDISGLIEQSEHTGEGSSRNGEKEMDVQKSGIRSIIHCLLRNTPFLIEASAVGLSIGSIHAILSIILDHTRVLQIPASDAVSIMLFINATNTGSRFVLAGFQLIPKMSVLLIPVLVTVISGVVLIVIPSVTDYISLTVLLCLGVGFGMGSLLTSLPLTTMKLVEFSMFPIATGIVQTAFGVSSVVMGPLIGLTKDSYDSYVPAFYLTGGILLVNSGILLVPYVMTTFRKRPTNQMFPPQHE